MPETQLLESHAIRDLRQESEARGMKFYLNPPRETVPAFLGDLQPDALLVGSDGGIVVGAMRGRNPVVAQRLAAMSRRVSGQKGWEFRAIYLSTPIDGIPDIAKPTPAQLEATFQEIEALTTGGHFRAGLVIAWAALESLARLARDTGSDTGSGGFAPIQTIQTLAEEGYLENEVAIRLREIAKLRNAVVHGDFSADVPAQQVEYLLGELRTIAADILKVIAEQRVVVMVREACRGEGQAPPSTASASLRLKKA